jgi:peptidyl-prolyl cis-trans isomerase SurA
MKKLATAFFVLASLAGSAQTLARYGTDSITVNEFLRAYKKNNAGAKNDQALRDYLDLYLNSRLKILEARNLRMDTLPQLLSDLDNLRQQILPSYLTDKEAASRLVDEAEARSKKDIHLAHIFIASSPAGDTTAASARANDALSRLKKGEDFLAVARAVSDDPSAKSNGGDLGWISVFSLPYTLENFAYTFTARVPAIIFSKTWASVNRAAA